MNNCKILTQSLLDDKINMAMKPDKIYYVKGNLVG